MYKTIAFNIVQYRRVDRIHFLLSNLCNAINHRTTIKVWDHVLAPKEFLINQVESKFSKFVL